MFSQKSDDDLRRQIRHEPEIESRHRSAWQHRLRAGVSVTGVNTADRAGRTEDVFFDERVAFHRAHPAADAKLALQSGFVELDAFRTSASSSLIGAMCDENPSIVITPFGEVIVARACTKRQAGLGTIVPHFECRSECAPNARSSKNVMPLNPRLTTGVLFRVARAFIPQATVSLQQLRILSREAIKTRTAKTILAFDKEAKRDRKFSKCLLIRFDCRKPRDQIAFTVRRAARVQLAVRIVAANGPEVHSVRWPTG